MLQSAWRLGACLGCPRRQLSALIPSMSQSVRFRRLIRWIQAYSSDHFHRPIRWTQAYSSDRFHRLIHWTQAYSSDRFHRLIRWTPSAKLLFSQRLLDPLLCLQSDDYSYVLAVVTLQ